MNQILTMFLFTIFLLLLTIVVGISVQSQLTIIIVVTTIFVVVAVFYTYMKYISKLANFKLRSEEQFNNLKLFLNFITMSNIDLKLYIDRFTATQIVKILNNDIYSVKNTYIYDALEGKYTANKIRNEILDELSFLNDQHIYLKLKNTYDILDKIDYSNSQLSLILLDTWCINQLEYMRKQLTTRIDSQQLSKLLNLIEDISFMIVENDDEDNDNY